MTNSKRIWMTRQDYTRLHNELAELRSRPSIEVPDDLMDYHASVGACYSARRARIRELRDVLNNAAVSEGQGGCAVP
ncbi:hypothetical protein [Mycobacterium szulgai]|uniref:Transcription elongation factor GreA/GreB N-terminal domain-containing protein n=1 Tax=Mycobacterium szulgai TaxID=1787 RepID=A0A1X2DHV5_MYCSZ|nr:hypothetical protein [Mycobacterium szulgai]MCV7076757.1 hypothetical protein [Mycobacterium szulgai]ORW87805.1 hypothetical protein AWC27_15680 [Mycobacterium szulgai]